MGIIANNLVKIYPNGKKAVNDVSFSLNKGEVFGFLGPNGAGKTTIVKLLSGVATPTSGYCTVFDVNPTINPVKIHSLAGVVTEHAQMYNSMTGLQNLVFYGSTFGLNRTDGKNRAINLFERLELSDAKDCKLETYSTGMRQRLSLARALMHSPKILFLDEPTSGLDPESVQNVNQMIRSLADDDGVTIFLCTHQLRYAQEICTSYGLISNGIMLASGNLEELRSLVFSGYKVNIKTDRLPKNISATKVSESNYEFLVKSEDEIPQIIKNITTDGGSIYHVITNQLSLEEIYFSLFEKSKEGAVLSND